MWVWAAWRSPADEHCRPRPGDHFASDELRIVVAHAMWNPRRDIDGLDGLDGILPSAGTAYLLGGKAHRLRTSAHRLSDSRHAGGTRERAIALGPWLPIHMIGWDMQLKRPHVAPPLIRPAAAGE